MVARSRLREVMESNGFRLTAFPSGKGSEFWFCNDKFPYSSQISEKRLMKIIEEVC